MAIGSLIRGSLLVTLVTVVASFGCAPEDERDELADDESLQQREHALSVGDRAPAHGGLAQVIADATGQRHLTTANAVARPILPACPCLEWIGTTRPRWPTTLESHALGNSTGCTGTLFPESAVCGSNADETWAYVQTSETRTEALFVEKNKDTELGNEPVCGWESTEAGSCAHGHQLRKIDILEYEACRAIILKLQASNPEASCL